MLIYHPHLLSNIHYVSSLSILLLQAAVASRTFSYGVVTQTLRRVREGCSCAILTVNGRPCATTSLGVRRPRSPAVLSDTMEQSVGLACDKHTTNPSLLDTQVFKNVDTVYGFFPFMRNYKYNCNGREAHMSDCQQTYDSNCADARHKMVGLRCLPHPQGMCCYGNHALLNLMSVMPYLSSAGGCIQNILSPVIY